MSSQTAAVSHSCFSVYLVHCYVKSNGCCVVLLFFQFTVRSSQAAPVSYCQRVTKQDCEEMSRITSQRSLRDLLDSIVEDEGMSDKGRKKQLKQVTQYPSTVINKQVTQYANTTINKQVTQYPSTVITSR